MPIYTKYANVRSVERDAGSKSSQQFRWTFPTAIPKPRKLTLASLELPLQVLNIRAPYNFYRWRLGQPAEGFGTDYTATIPEGNYTISELLAQMNTSLTAVQVGAVTYTINNTTGRIRHSTVNSCTIYDTPLARMLGFAPNQQSQGADSFVTAQNSYSISMHDSYYLIHISNLSSNYISKSVPTTFKIPITLDSGYILYFTRESSGDQHIDLSNIDQLAYLEISIFDPNGYIVPLEGMEWSMSLEIEYEEERTIYS